MRGTEEALLPPAFLELLRILISEEFLCYLLELSMSGLKGLI